jgi:hypothetical protein
MRNVWKRLGTVLGAVLLVSGAQARADFSYSNTFTPPTFTSDNPGSSLAPSFSTTPVAVTTGTTSGFTNWTPVNVTGNAPTGTATYTGDNNQFTVDLKLTTGSLTHDFVFKGEIFGTISQSNGSTLNAQLFTVDGSGNPTSTLAPLSSTIVETATDSTTGVMYTAKLFSNLPIGQPGSAATSLDGEIDWTALTGNTGGGDTGGGNNGGGNPQSSPEPSTMLLSCLGLSCLGASAWRKRRARR